MENNENQPETSEGTQPSTEATTPQEAPATESTPQPEAPAAAPEPQAAPEPPAAATNAPVKKQVAPGAIGAMVFGIVGAVLGLTYGLGAIFSIISLVKLKSVKATFNSDPVKYSVSKGFITAGTVCAWVGIGLSVLGLLMLLIVIGANF
jgi:hypothetical protein